MANSGAKRRDWCGRWTQERRDEHLGAKGGSHTSVDMHAVLRHSESASLPLCSHMVGVGSCRETKLAWAESCTALKAPEGQHGELQHWPCASGSHSEGSRARSLV